MTIKEAIEKAIEGGYNNFHQFNSDEQVPVEFYNHCFLDPLFWQSLGKAMGWKDLTNKNFDIYELRMNLSSKTVVQKFTETWRWEMHRFIDHLAEGKVARAYDWWEINQVKNVSKKDNPHPLSHPIRTRSEDDTQHDRNR